MVISNHTTVSQILTDATNRSVVHILPKAILKLGDTLTTPCFVESGAIIEPASGSEIIINQWLYLLGNITFSNGEKFIINGNMTMGIQNFTSRELLVGTTGIMTTIPLSGGGIFPLDTEIFRVYGQFKSDVINITGIDEFTVGKDGTVEMTPVSADMYIGKIVSIHGSVNLSSQEVSIVHPCQSFQITGSGSRLVWNDKGNITVECEFVYINGYFKPGTINFGSGAEILKVGYYGDFEFTADGPILTNSFWADGTTKIDNIVEFKSLNSSDLRIEVFVLDDGGHLYLNHQSSPKLVDGKEVSFTYI